MKINQLFQWVAIIGLVSAAVPTFAFADSFQIFVTRVQGDFNCEVSGADGGSSDCSTNIKGRTKFPITMNLSEDGKTYVGADTISEGKDQYILTVGADSAKKFTSVVMMHLQSTGEKSFRGNLTISETNTLATIQVAPLEVEGTEGEGARARVAFVAYSPSSVSNLVTAQDSKQLTQFILGNIRASLSAIRR